MHLINRLAQSFLATHLDLTEAELDLVSDWGRAGIGLSDKVPSRLVSDLTELGKKLPKKKVPTLYRGMMFPRGTIFGEGVYTSEGVTYDPKFIDSGYGLNILDDPPFYHSIVSGPRSWSTQLSSAKYYAGGHALTRDSRRPDGIVIRWTNPSPASIILDTRAITGAGYQLATDKNEVVADASGAKIGKTTFENHVLILDITG